MRGGSNPPSSSEEAQWEDITTVGEDKATGREAKEAKSTPRGNSCVQGRTKPSPRRNKRGFWLGRRSKLLGEASKKQNNVHQGGTMVCGDQNSTTTRVKWAGREGSGQELDTKTQAGTIHNAAQGPN